MKNYSDDELIDNFNCLVNYAVGIRARICVKHCWNLLEDNPFQVITDYQLDQNIKSDVEFLNDRLPELKENTNVEDLYLDGGYYFDKIAEFEKENEVELHFTNLSGRNPSKKTISCLLPNWWNHQHNN